MLVLTRKESESLMIGDEVEISVLSIVGERVRIGIDAPRAVPVFRKEIYLDIKRDRAAQDDVQAVDRALDVLKGD